MFNYINKIPEKSTNYGPLVIFFAMNSPKIMKRRNRNRKIPKRIFAIPAAIPAMPVNPNKPAINEIIKKITAHFNILLLLEYVVYLS